MRCTINDIAIVTMGQSPKSEFYNTNGEGLPFLQGNRTFGRLYPTFDTYTTFPTKIAEAGDVIMSVRAPVGDLNITPVKMCLGRGVCSLRMKNGNQQFLYYLMKAIVPQLISKESGTVFGSVNRNDICSQEVDIPEDAEHQRVIARYLSAIDEKIETNHRINDNLYEMVNAYYTSLFKDVECEMTTIGNYAERIYSGGTPTTSNAAYWDGAFGWFSSGETRNRFVISTEKTITQAGIDNSSTKLAAKHDIVMASAGQGFTRGQTSMLLIDTYVNQSVIVIHAERKVLPYLFWNLANRYEELRAISDSSSIRGSLTTKMIAAFEIPLAKEESLQAFADFSWSVIPQIENNLLENERLAALRDNLLPKLMLGEIDVSDIQL